MNEKSKWWLSHPKSMRKFCESCESVEIESIGETAGGHSIWAASCGEISPRENRTAESLSSAMGARNPEAFYGTTQGHQPTFLFVGATHGTEIEGSVAAMNLFSVIHSGSDLRGKAWPHLAELARQCRIACIPVLNMDGRLRYSDFEDAKAFSKEEMDAITFGSAPDGTPLTWQDSKNFFPMPSSDSAQLGSYFNDNGVNLVYDRIGPDCQPETAALLRFCAKELPDCTLLSHTNWGSLIESPGIYLPMQQKIRALQIGAVVGNACRTKGYTCNIPQTLTGPARLPFYQSDLLYHACGTLPLLVEFPSGAAKQNIMTCEEILDLGLTCIEEILAFNLAYGTRPTDLP